MGKQKVVVLRKTRFGWKKVYETTSKPRAREYISGYLGYRSKTIKRVPRNFRITTKRRRGMAGKLMGGY